MTAPSLATIEASSVRTWPSERDEPLDGWVLRFSDGSTRRATSVNILRSSQLPVTWKVGRAIDEYHGRRLTCTFRMTDVAEHAVTRELDVRNFRHAAGALVMVRSLTDRPTGTPTAAVTNAATPDDRWLGVLAVDRPSTYSAHAVARVLAGHDLPSVYTTATAAGSAVSIGQGVVDGSMMAIFNMRTRPDARRSGHARTVLQSLLDAAVDRGVGVVYLQVEATNTPAISLYRAAGFAISHEYHYRFLPPA